MSDSENFQTQDLSSIHKYRTETPNIIFEYNLSPQEGWLYLCLKKIAGDNGNCTASIKYLENLSKIKKTKISECKKILFEKNLIKITKRFKNDGSRTTDLIQIIDLWPKNFVHFKEKFTGSRDEAPPTATRSTPNRHTVDPQPPHGRKEEPLKKKEPLNKEKENKEKKKSASTKTEQSSLASEEAHFCAKYLFDKLKKMRPDRKEPNWKAWSKEFDLMIKLDGISKEKIIAALDWKFDTINKFVVASPKALREKFENISDHMIIKSQDKSIYKRFAGKVAECMNLRFLNINEIGVYDKNSRFELSYSMPYEDFCRCLAQRYGVAEYKGDM